MTTLNASAPRQRIAPLGLLYLSITSLGWGLNWPIMKHLLAQWPPLSSRGLSGVIGGLVLAGIALASGAGLRVPASQWPRLILSSLLNVTMWVALMGLALVYLPAGEAAVIAFTMPVWTSLLAWPVLGERITVLRVVALVMAFAGVASVLGGTGFSATREKLPGIILALTGSVGFALGSVMVKRFPIALPLMTSTAWQFIIGCVPVAIAGLIYEQPSIGALDGAGWAMMGYLVLVQFCVSYLCWFAALKQLPASVATIGTLAVPVIGVVASAITLGEPLGVAQIAALAFTMAGVLLATRS